MFDFDVRAGDDLHDKDRDVARDSTKYRLRPGAGELDEAAFASPGLPRSPAALFEASNLSLLRVDEMAAGITIIPRRPAVAVSPGCRLREAFRLMTGRHAGAALVASHGVLLGMLHERDVVRRLLDAEESAGDLPVWRVMTAQTETLVESDTVAYALQKLWARDGRAMPIVGSSGTPLGVLETQDVVAWMCGRVGAPLQEKLPRNAT